VGERKGKVTVSYAAVGAMMSLLLHHHVHTWNDGHTDRMNNHLISTNVRYVQMTKIISKEKLRFDNRIYLLGYSLLVTLSRYKFNQRLNES